jgi:hypothetical protein
MAAEPVIATLKANPISVVCGALALTLAVGIYLRSGRVPEGEALLEQKVTQGERIDANLKNGVQLADQFAAITTARKEIEARLIRPDELAKNLQFFYKLEADTGTKLVELRQNVIPTGKPGAKLKTAYMGVGYGVAVRGDYVRLLDFLRRLESGQRFCRVMTLTLVGTGGGAEGTRGNELTLNLSLELLGQP